MLNGCSSIPNVNLDIEGRTESDWNTTLVSLLPNDPVPSEIKLEDGNYLVADVTHVRDGDTITVTNIDKKLHIHSIEGYVVYCIIKVDSIATKI